MELNVYIAVHTKDGHLDPDFYQLRPNIAHCNARNSQVLAGDIHELGRSNVRRRPRLPDESLDYEYKRGAGPN